jgi:hypothetical protein
MRSEDKWLILASSSIALRLFPSRIFDFLYQNFVDIDLKWGKKCEREKERKIHRNRRTDREMDGTDEETRG